MDEPSPLTRPLATVSRADSPFSVVEDVHEARLVEPGRPARLPERRKPESPFQAAAFLFPGGHPVMGVSPFTVEQGTQGPVPFAGFVGWPGNSQPQGYGYAPQGFALGPQGGYPVFAPSQAAPAMPVPKSFASAAPESAPASTAASAASSYRAAQPAQQASSDSCSIRQLELRAIFGVGREMAEEEILKRSRALPGMRNLARLQVQEMGTIEELKHLMNHLGFGDGEVRLYSGSAPLDFIREGNVVLAVQTEGGFAPGVREILMLVARELGRMA